MALTLYVATTNAGKLRDFATAAEKHNIIITPVPNLKGLPPVEETATTFEGNARLKAEAYSLTLPGEFVLADDSGIEVGALDGAPGVRSARYAADAGMTDSPDANDNTDVWNNILLLTNLKSVPAGERIARYRCVLAVAKNGKTLLTADGALEGVLLESPRGTGGFGYDPLLYLPELGLTMAEIEGNLRHQLSHRGRAFRALLPELDKLAEA
jgi:XTP/dITP diphosphohydrolase